jgi:transglutaminase-like putative cysteine protease
MRRYRTELIGRPQTDDDKFFGDVNTQGIIDTVLYADEKCKAYTVQFAKTLRSEQLFDTCKNIWDFIKTQIPYVLDKRGYQWIKSPGRLWQEKSGDCKSFSVFAASCLKNLGIKYGYRFTSYDPNDKTPTHVYVYVPLPRGEIIIDAVWTGPFNSQKPFAYKIDYPVSATAGIAGVGKMNKFINAFNPATLPCNRN